MENEDGKIEYKQTLNNRLKREIVSFLNSDGGTIFIGVDDNTNPLNINSDQKHQWEEILSSWSINAFYPIPYGLIDVLPNEEIFTIKISEGNNKPYAIANKGFDSSGVYIREGSHAVKASNELIKRMQQQNLANGAFDSAISNNQNLKFDSIKNIFERINTKFDQNALQMTTDSKFNNAALLVSEENTFVTKVAVYEGLNVMVFRDKTQFSGSTITQIDETMNYLRLVNHTKIIITGSPQRIERRDYPEAAIRESLVNALVHRDYFLHSDVKIEVFDDRMDIISPGGIPDGLSLKEIENGSIAARNPRLIHILNKLGYIENYGTGIRRIISSYADDSINPTFTVSANMFKVSLPNRNYSKPSSHFVIEDPSMLSNHEQIIIKVLSENLDGLSRTAIQDQSQLTRYQSLTTVKSLISKELIKKVGSGRSTTYQLNY